MRFTEPKDMHDLVIHVMGWNEEGAGRQFEFLKNQGYPYVVQWVHRDRHETENMNGAIREAVSFGAKYWHMANDDVEYRYTETIPSLYDYLRAYPNVGAIRPFTQGEPANPFAQPYEQYLGDATGLTLRLEMEDWIPRFDEEFLGTGWAELDLGYEAIRRGWLVMNDMRYPVRHDKTNSKAQDKKVFLMALGRRNRLILSAKWRVVGRDKWISVSEYNRTLPPHKRIPTMHELFNYTTEELELLWRSVHPEHDAIFQANGDVDPNDYWENIVLGGQNVREMYEQGKLREAIASGKVIKGAG